MTKQVSFAGGRTAHSLRQDDALSRGVDERETALEDVGMNFSRGLKINTPPPAARCEPQLQHGATKQIPKTTTAAPTLKHTVLTPAQRQYLHTVAASHSAAHVRSLITQHYMNVLHRCRAAAYNPEGDDHARTSAAIIPGTDGSEKHQSEVPSLMENKEKTIAGGRNPRKSTPPKIPNRQTRLSNTSASKQGKVKNCASPSLRRTTPRRATVRTMEEEEEEEGQYDSLSECISSLSLGEWEDDTSSDM